MSNDPKLDSCRFCGSNDLFITAWEQKLYNIECSTCFATGPDTLSRDEAIQRWNGPDKRSPTEHPTELKSHISN